MFHLQHRPEHVKFRNGPPANLTQLDVMFRKAHVTGENSAILGEEETGKNKEAAIPLDDDDDASKRTPLVKCLKFGGGEKEKESRRCASATTGGGHNRRRTKGAKEVVHGS